MIIGAPYIDRVFVLFRRNGSIYEVEVIDSSIYSSTNYPFFGTYVWVTDMNADGNYDLVISSQDHVHILGLESLGSCSSSPCQNDGVCTDLINDYNCTCSQLFR